MNDIRFRLIKDGQIVGYERHILVDGEIEIQHKLPGKHSWHDIRFEPAIFIHHDAKDQFTGLRDKNGKDIYENDRAMADTEAEGYIVFYCGRFCWTDGACHWDIIENADDGTPIEGIEENDRALCMEVIGTIHDTGK